MVDWHGFVGPHFLCGCDSYLIDPSISELSRTEAITMDQLHSGGWLVYDCSAQPLSLRTV